MEEGDEAFQTALDDFTAENSGDAATSGYYASLTRSLSLVLDEFYSVLHHCGVSAATGDGVSGFWDAVDRAAQDFEADYVSDLRDRVEDLVAIHSAALGYAPDGAYGEDDQALGRSMKILPSERARDIHAHPLIRTHHENGSKALFSSAAYITGFEGMAREESEALLMSLYAHQTQPEFIYTHRWEAGMVVMWDNRSLLHAATGGYAGYDRLLHRTTIADTQF